LNILDQTRYWPIPDCLYLAWFYPNPLRIDNIPQKVNFVYIKGTLGEIGIKVILLQLFENTVNVLYMLFFILQINQNIIKINNTNSIDQVTQNLIDKGLEGH
jgi:hypothetical protein